MNGRSVCSVSVLVALGCATPDAAIDRTEGREGLRGLELERTFAAPDFAFSDTEGRVFDFRAETAGSLTLLFFGYTHCPDICPVQMSILDAALSQLSYAQRAGIEVVFVTIDPARDTPERLRAWLDRFDTSFVGLIGDIDEVNEVQAALKLPPAAIDAPGGWPSGRAGASSLPTTRPAKDYVVGHATPVVAITGEGLVRAFYPSGVRQTDWQHDLPLLLRLSEAQGDGGPAGAGDGG